MKARSFATVLTTLFTALVAFPIFLGVYFFQNKAIGNETLRINTELSTVQGRIQNTLNEELRLMTTRLKTLGSDSDLRIGNRSILFFDRINRRLADFKSDTPLAQEVYFFGTNGNIIASIPHQLESQDLTYLQRALISVFPTQVNTEKNQHVGNDLKAVNASGEPDSYFLHQQVTDIYGESAGDVLTKIDQSHLKNLAQQNLSLDINREAFGKSWRVERNDVNSPKVNTASAGDSQVALGQLKLSFQLEPSLKVKHSLSQQSGSLYFAFFAALVGVLGTWMLTQQFLKPLKAMKAQIQNFELFHLQKKQRGSLLGSPTPTPFSEFNDFQNVLYKMGLEIFNSIATIEAAASRESDLKRQQITAQLNTLKNQLNPHFLFNALNGIQSMMDVDGKEASEMVQDLSDLYRNILKCTNKVTILVHEEISIVQNYLKFQKRRFGERLSFDTVLPSQSDIWIPSLIIQTLVENAVKHGLEPYKEGCHISVAITQAKQGYLCSVKNKRNRSHLNSQKESTGSLLVSVPLGDPDPKFQPKGTGTGLANTQSRLELLYGNLDPLSCQFENGDDAMVSFVFSGEKK